ncbi:glycosyltransferase [Candidatus Aminicenantes bacterium AC-335-A11]|jgi:glycosyltransferase involved in cell wall biosynthesis|nr:glycosyltransferase [SCandidatus Aminicenantes bacterium Aminicenantia_JdfR_composite]MCP2617924.1 glycosyltransferase [Candidatus Aminicenantes bacterium AC-335-A11]
MKICLFGAYAQDDTRTTIIKKGLKKNGIEIIECFTNVKYKFWLRYPVLFAKYLKFFKKHDYFLVPAFRHKDIPLAKFLSLITKKPLIFDPLVSRYETIVLDWRKLKKGSLQAKWNYLIDKISFKMSDLILSDTLNHIKYYYEEFNVPFEKMNCLPVGVDESIFYPREDRIKKHFFLVQFFGSFLPLHGIEYIVEAAHIVQKKDNQIKFELIGSGRTLPKIKELIEKKNVNNIILKGKWVDVYELPDLIAKADICLGVFSKGEKANRVIPNKIYQSLAMKKPLITAETDAIKEIFEHKKHLFLCKPGDGNSLACAILELKNDSRLRKKIAENGYQFVFRNFTTEQIGKKFKEIIENTFQEKS